MYEAWIDRALRYNLRVPAADLTRLAAALVVAGLFSACGNSAPAI